MEADIAFRDEPDESKADQIDGAIGEGSDFAPLLLQRCARVAGDPVLTEVGSGSGIASGFDS